MAMNQKIYVTNPANGDSMHGQGGGVGLTITAGTEPLIVTGLIATCTNGSGSPTLSIGGQIAYSFSLVESVSFIPDYFPRGIIIPAGDTLNFNGSNNTVYIHVTYESYEA